MLSFYGHVFAVSLRFCMPTPILPQITTAEITGTVADSGRALVAGATVTVINTATSATPPSAPASTPFASNTPAPLILLTNPKT